MKHAQNFPSPRGGAPVGMMDELPPLEMAAIYYLRMWFSGKQVEIWRGFNDQFEPADAEAAMAALEALMHNVQRHSRRQFMRHDLKCNCFGGDEGAFAQFVAAATNGEDHDAMTFGLHLFSGVQAKTALSAAAMCGHALNSIATDIRSGKTRATTPNQTHPSPILKQ